MKPWTSISSKSAFSTGGRMLAGDYQIQLQSDNIEVLLCQNDWIHAQEGVSDEE